MLSELNGVVHGSGVDFVWIERMQLRVWNRVPKQPLPEEGCTAIGMLTEDAGVVVGGTLDDPRQSYVLVRRIPDEGIPHVQVAWAGTTWGQNGTNAAGLCFASASLGAVEPPIEPPGGPYGLNGTVGRLILQECHSVAEAVALLERTGPTGSYVLGDASGALVGFQGLGPYQAFVEPEDGMVFCTNHVYLPELRAALAERGAQPVISDYSRTRFETLQRARADGARTLAAMEGLLRSHTGYPHSICNDGTVMASIAAPESQPEVFRIADRTPCRNKFAAYAIEA
jgi:hypothetical protein